MYAPAVKWFHHYGKRLIRSAVIEQSTHNAVSSIRCPFRKSELIRSEIVIQFNFIPAARVLLPLFEALNAILKGCVTNTFGVLRHLVVVFLTFDFHIR